MSGPRIGVFIVDDHAVVRAGLRALLENTDDIRVVGEAADGHDALVALRGAERDGTDVVLMDLSMPEHDGVEATRALSLDPQAPRVLVLTSFADDERVLAALRAGAVGYVLKDSAPQEILAAIRSTHAGGIPLDPRITSVLLPSRGDDEPAERASDPTSVTDPHGLSPRQHEVLVLIAEGLANKQIGHRLGISERTVKAHIGAMFRTIGVSDRTSAALWLERQQRA